MALPPLTTPRGSAVYWPARPRPGSRSWASRKIRVTNNHSDELSIKRLTFIDDAVRLTGTLAAALHAEVTLFHVVAEPPAIYAHLVRLEENVDALLASGSELGRNLVAEKKALEKLGVVVHVHVRHGFVVDQL